MSFCSEEVAPPEMLVLMVVPFVPLPKGEVDFMSVGGETAGAAIVKVVFGNVDCYIEQVSPQTPTLVYADAARAEAAMP